MDLKTYIESDPTLAGKSPAEIAFILNEKNIPVLQEKFVTKRTLAAMLGVQKAVTVMQTLKAMIANPVYEFIYDLLNDVAGSGIDLGLPESQLFVDQFVLGGLLSSEDATTLKNLAIRYISRAERDFGRAISENEIAQILGAKAVWTLESVLPAFRTPDNRWCIQFEVSSDQGERKSEARYVGEQPNNDACVTIATSAVAEMNL